MKSFTKYLVAAAGAVVLGALPLAGVAAADPGDVALYGHHAPQQQRHIQPASPTQGEAALRPRGQERPPLPRESGAPDRPDRKHSTR